MNTITPAMNWAPIYPTSGLTCEQKISNVFAHEKKERNIDWLGLAAQGPAGIRQAKVLARAHLHDLQAQLQIRDEDIPIEIKALLNSMGSSNGADVMPIWPLNEQSVATWAAARGGDLKDLIATQISAMQSIQTVHNDPSQIALISLGIGVVAWVKTAWTAFQAIRAVAGATEAYAVVMGVIEAGPAVVTFAVTTIFLAVLLPILAIMLKDATCYMVIINETPEDLELDGDVYLTHGNLNIIFSNYLSLKPIIPGAVIIQDPTGKIISKNYFAGIMVAQKKEAALYGSQGALKFKNTATFPSGVFIGWEIPLTKIGGNNRCLVDANYTGSTNDFSNKTNDDGGGESTSTIGSGTITARMNSSGGSQGYMAAVATVVAKVFQTTVCDTPTTFSQENDGTWGLTNYTNGSLPDLFFIKTQNTPNGHVEVHIASGDSNYKQRVMETATTFSNENDGVWLMSNSRSNELPDLVLIKTANIPNGKVEVHIASGASNYQTRTLETATTFSNENDGTWLLANFSKNNTPDLIFIKTANTPGEKIEVHIASGASNYQTRILEVQIPFSTGKAGTWCMADYDKDGIPDLVFIESNNVPNSHAQVKIFSGASNYQTLILDAPSGLVNSTGVWLMKNYGAGATLGLAHIGTSTIKGGDVEIQIAK